jgi:hypothetical protein
MNWPALEREEIIGFLKPQARFTKHNRGDVTIMYDVDLGNYVTQQGDNVCRDLVPTKEFVQAIDSAERRPGETIYIAWSVVYPLTFHLAFDRDKLISDADAGTAMVKTEYARLYAFCCPYQEEILLDSDKAEFIVFRKHLRSLPPALYRAASGLRSF